MMLLSRASLNVFVDRYFRDRAAFLDLAATAGSPLYVLDTGELRDRAARFRSAFEARLPGSSYYYAVKCNHHPQVADTVVRAGFGLDVSSGAELELALGTGTRDVVFSGPGKTDDELSMAVNHADVVTVLMDSVGELRRLGAVASSQRRSIRTGVRLATTTEGLWRKFGVAIDALPDFFEEAERHPYVQLSGLQFHTSWNLTPQSQVEFIAAIGRAVRGWPKAWLERIEFVDVGGGYWPERGEWLRADSAEDAGRVARDGHRGSDPLEHHCRPATQIDAYAAELTASLAAHLADLRPFRVCFEPGRWIVDAAMHLLLTVVDVKGKGLAITDAGINAIGWERFETDYAPVLNLSRPSLDERACDIVGSLCTPHDVFGAACFGEEVQPGDVLLIPCQGAYTFSLRQSFIKPIPAVARLR